MRRLLPAVLLLPLAAGCATPLTPSRVTPSFGEAFAGLYAQQQVLLERPGAAARDLTTTCRRTGADSDGPGEDWVCAVQFDDDGTRVSQAFDLQVKPDGCWKADGAPGVQQEVLVAPSGLRSLNPLLQFDGCLDTSWR